MPIVTPAHCVDVNNIPKAGNVFYWGMSDYQAIYSVDHSIVSALRTLTRPH
jgi:hypothetical protein